MEESRKKPKPIELPNLHKLGVNPEDAESILSGITNPRFGTESPIHISIIKNYSLLTKWLFQHKEVDVNALNSMGETPLHYAAKKLNGPIMEALIKEGANVNLPDMKGFTPLHIVAYVSKDSVGMNILIAAGVDVNVSSGLGHTPLMYAIKNENKDGIEALLAAGANINKNCGLHEETHLIYAVVKDNVDIVQLLIARGANLEADIKGNTALHYAVTKNNAATVDVLIQAGANINAKNRFGITPLYESLRVDNMDVIRRLLASGANVHALTNTGISPLQYILKSGLFQKLDLFLQYMNINEPMDDKGTLLQYACNTKNGNLLLFLKERGADGTGIVCDDIILHELAVKPFVIHEPNVYYFGGHGCDTGEVLTVPPGCVYITLSICGDYSLFHYNYVERMKQCGPLLRNPVANKKEIERIVGRGIQMYGEGETYTDVYYTVPSKFTIGKDCPPNYNTQEQQSLFCTYVTNKSGLYNIDDLDSHIVDVHNGDTYVFDDYRTKRLKYASTVNPDIINKIYGKSLLPSRPPHRISDTAKNTYDTIPRGSIRQSMLFKLYPGIYYNLVCRIPCNIPAPVQLRRQYSIGKRHTINVSDIKQMFDNDTSKGKADSLVELQKLIDDPSIYFVEDSPGDFDKAVRSNVNARKLTGTKDKERHRIILRATGGTRRKKKYKRKTRMVLN